MQQSTTPPHPKIEPQKKSFPVRRRLYHLFDSKALKDFRMAPPSIEALRVHIQQQYSAHAPSKASCWVILDGLAPRRTLDVSTMTLLWASGIAPLQVYRANFIFFELPVKRSPKNLHYTNGSCKQCGDARNCSKNSKERR
jgi:hypothetical protein